VKDVRFIALLRGINVGGRNKVPMAELREVLTEASFEDVATYIQSGNILLNGNGRQEADVVKDVEAVMSDHFGLDIPVVVRSIGQWAEIIAANPFPKMVDEPKMLHVYLCREAPTKAALKQFDTSAYPNERFAASGRELYVFYTDGVARSKLSTNELERRLNMTTTGRNWSTMTKLAAMVEAT